MNLRDKDGPDYSPTQDELDWAEAHDGYMEWCEAMDGAQAARDGLLKAGLTAVRVGSGGKLKEDEE